LLFSGFQRILQLLRSISDQLIDDLSLFFFTDLCILAVGTCSVLSPDSLGLFVEVVRLLLHSELFVDDLLMFKDACFFAFDKGRLPTSFLLRIGVFLDLF
jgi:hypothetical protein